jgi:hypothetical protein
VILAEWVPLWILIVLIALVGGATWWELHLLTAVFTAATGGLELIREGIGNLIGVLRDNAAPKRVLERIEALETEQRASMKLAADALALARSAQARRAAEKRWEGDDDEDPRDITLTPEAKAQLLEQLTRAGVTLPGVGEIVRPDGSSSGKSLKQRAFEHRRRIGEV